MKLNTINKKYETKLKQIEKNGYGKLNTYNGWKNYETWNVALWISNDEGLYEEARRFRSRGYKDFVKSMLEAYGDGTFVTTPDGVAWNDSGLDIEALDKMMEDL